MTSGPQFIASLAWYKFALAFGSFATGALNNSVTLFNLPARGVVHGIKIMPTASFAGGGITAYTVSVGVSGSLGKYASAFDCFQAPGSRIYQLSANFGGEDTASQTPILATATAVGDNLNAATSGSVIISALISVSP